MTHIASAQRANPACEQCCGTGLIVETKGSLAKARECQCIPKCDSCRGQGRRLEKTGEIMRMVPCACQLSAHRVNLFNQAQIPARHANASFQTFEHTSKEATRALGDTMRWCKSFVEGGATGTGLILHGGVGRGKTHLMIAAIRSLILEHGVSVRFIEFSHLLADLKKGYDEGRGESKTLGTLGEINLLAIDELGKGKSTDWERAIADELVSRRYNSLRPLMATTNYPPARSTGVRSSNLSDEASKQTLEDRVGERVFSRLMQMCVIQRISGDDYRARGR
jgi:DNA replication protein DnaC